MAAGSQAIPSRSAEPLVVVVAGPAGSGKTTLGRALARTTGAALLDLDSVTNPVLDAVADLVPGPHWLSGPHSAQIRTGRYAALRTTAADVLAGGVPVVLVAPFTAELQGGAEWGELCTALAPHPLHVLHLEGSPELLAARRAARGEARDAFRPADGTPLPVAVAHTRIEVLLSPEQQLSRALQAIGVRRPLDPAEPLLQRGFDAVLFDLDGTLADSTPAVLRSWARLAAEFDFPVDAVQRNHGKPARPLLSALLPADRVEAALVRVEELETEDVGDITATPGARELLSALPADRVAIVTSGRRGVVRARLAAAGIEPPAVLITRDDVTEAKPHPEPYLAAAAALGIDPHRCLAVEDAEAGVSSARAAGCAVLAVSGTSQLAELAGADLVVDGLDQLRVVAGAGAVRFTPAG